MRAGGPFLALRRIRPADPGLRRDDGGFRPQNL